MQHRYIAFLRAMNVGGRNIKMEQLRGHFETLGYTDVASFIASGNIIFSTPEGDPTELRTEIEAHLVTVLGYEVVTFLRTPAQVAAIAAHPPIPADEVSAAGALNVGLLHAPLSPQREAAVQALATDIDRFFIHQREVYWFCATKQSESTFSNAVLEKTLGLPATFRTIRTFARLAAKYPA
jgi:uncharacterized protein (DUF1697 family)